MKNLKRIMAMVTVLVVVTAAGMALASEILTPPKIVANLTGKTADEVEAARASGQTYGGMAKAAGKLDEFKKETLAYKKEILDQKVQEGLLTAAERDEIYQKLEERQAYCDGSGQGQLGQGSCGFAGQGAGMGKINGFGHGKRHRMHLGN